jgi:hypothetical protein
MLPLPIIMQLSWAATPGLSDPDDAGYLGHRRAEITDIIRDIPRIIVGTAERIIIDIYRRLNWLQEI